VVSYLRPNFGQRGLTACETGVIQMINKAWSGDNVLLLFLLRDMRRRAHGESWGSGRGFRKWGGGLLGKETEAIVEERSSGFRNVQGKKRKFGF